MFLATSLVKHSHLPHPVFGGWQITGHPCTTIIDVVNDLYETFEQGESSQRRGEYGDAGGVARQIMGCSFVGREMFLRATN